MPSMSTPPDEEHVSCAMMGEVTLTVKEKKAYNPCCAITWIGELSWRRVMTNGDGVMLGVWIGEPVGVALTGTLTQLSENAVAILPALFELLTARKYDPPDPRNPATEDRRKSELVPDVLVRICEAKIGVEEDETGQVTLAPLEAPRKIKS
jgi:hypothetical protein